MNEETKPNCYNCIYRANVIGSAHSSCNHKKLQPLLNDPLIRLLGMLAPFGREGSILVDITNQAQIEANYHGIANGWFNWPFDFDPVWLNKCNWYTPRETK